MNQNKTKAILIFGPTGVSKSDISIEVAKDVGEIISADSMQIYKKMDIGTAKLSKKIREVVPHYLIDIVEPDRYFSVLRFRDESIKLVHEISKRGKLPFIVGGTGLYFKALIDGLFKGPDRDSQVRERLGELYDEKGADHLHNQLKSIDPESASKIHLNDKKRIVRAIEVFELTGETLSQFWRNQTKEELFHFLKIGITLDRQELYQKIERRCDEMLEQGLIDEIRALKEAGYTKELQSMQGIGYQHFLNYLDGVYSLEESIRLFKRDTRRLAKRQWTLFLRFHNTHWCYPNEIEKIKHLVKAFINKKINL